ncbi:MAG: discoidin domain-containing protein [Acidobacteria bacterium]|nr:discoidin domain-containing protein [Acidobacteriota bacterium]
MRASEGPANHPPQAAVDGSPATYWMISGSKSLPSWIELSWKEAVRARQVVIRRIGGETGAADLTQITVESLDNGVWKPVARIGDGRTSLPLVIDASFAECTTKKLRFSGLDAHAYFREIEVFSAPLPAWLDVRGDARGNIIGILTQGSGAAGLETTVQVAGRAAGKPWKASAATGKQGTFTLAMPVGLSGPVEFTANVSGQAVRKTVDAGDIHQGLVPQSAEGAAIQLNGKWRFQADPAAGFETVAFDDRAWSDIDVPSHWVMQGFESREGRGGYRRHVSIPAEWQGRRIRIAFDGVYSGAEVWWNGRRVGSHLGGATPFQLDVTDAAKSGDNVLAVLVTEKTPASNLDHMSAYADFPLAGIMRAARVFSLPAAHISRLQAHSEFDASFQDATLITEFSVANESSGALSGATLRLRLLQNQNAVASSEPIALDLAAWSKAEQKVRIPVTAPQKWTAEHPNLYTLEAVIARGGNEIQRVTRQIGFRQTRVEKTAILINGVPVKFKGTAHHDSHPLMGRAVTPELERQDLELMKEANLDAVRTSHYPPLPELLRFADELGLYVEDEAPFCWVDEAQDLRWGALTRQLTAELVERDMSHPSVAYWSAGNESDWGPVLELGAEEIRNHDPSRPVMGSWSRTDHFDMTIRHNPITVGQIRELENNPKPVLWDESLAPFQGIFGDGAALWRDPGYRDYYGAPLVAVLDEFWKSKTVQGSFIWAWSDELFLIPNRGSEYGRHYVEGNGLARSYYQKGRGLTGDAPWGVIDGWRRRKPEFWHIQKLYSPIKVDVSPLPAPASGSLRIPVENKYFFTNLSELAVEWKIGTQTGTARADIAPQTSGMLEIPVAAGISPGSPLELRFQKGSHMVDTVVVPVGEAPAKADSLPQASPLRRYDQAILSGVTPRLEGDGFAVGISGRRGLLQYVSTKGAVLYDQPQIHITPTREMPAPFPNYRTWTLDRPVDIAERDGGYVITAQGHYPDLVGTYTTTITPSGEITVSYSFTYSGPDVRATEIGFRLELPLSLDTLSWKRKGEWTWYPADHIGALSGQVKAHSGRPSFVIPDWPYSEDDTPLGSNMYRSSKRNFLEAEAKDDSGLGWKILSDGTQHLRAAVEDQCIAIFVNEWFGGTSSEAGEWISNYGDGKLLQSGDHLQATVHLRLLAGKQ